jgi:uncharacterized protein YtpQ (UPF0354 family)
MDDDDLILKMQCDVEMQFEGPNNATMRKWAADALRRLADRIEKDEFKEDGFYPVKDNVGKNVGKVYISYESERIF